MRSDPETGEYVLLADPLVSFLMSKAVTAQLRDTSFIACPELAGSKLGGDCSKS